MNPDRLLPFRGIICLSMLRPMWRVNLRVRLLYCDVEDYQSKASQTLLTPSRHSSGTSHCCAPLPYPTLPCQTPHIIRLFCVTQNILATPFASPPAALPLHSATKLKKTKMTPKSFKPYAFRSKAYLFCTFFYLYPKYKNWKNHSTL